MLIITLTNTLIDCTCVSKSDFKVEMYMYIHHWAHVEFEAGIFVECLLWFHLFWLQTPIMCACVWKPHTQTNKTVCVTSLVDVASV